MPEPGLVLIVPAQETRQALRAALQGQGYRLSEAVTAAEGLEEVATGRPGVVILDLGLAGSLEVIRRIREWSAVPIIALSTRGREPDLVAALDAGADDCVNMPPGAGELLARIRVALRHAATSRRRRGDPVVTVGDLEVDLARQRVRAGGREVHLTPIEYRLLAALARQAGTVLGHDRLLREVWGPGRVDERHYLRVYMAQLRRKLETDAARPRYLLTEPNVGYRLAGE
jgi:two-component system KDP operon response regulator KdpE